MNDYNKAKESIPFIVSQLMKPHIKQVDRAIRHGLIFTTWNSLNHQLFFHNVEKALNQLKRIIREVNDLKEARIDEVLHDITTTVLVDFDDESSFTTTQFLIRSVFWVRPFGIIFRKLFNVFEYKCANLWSDVVELAKAPLPL